MTGEAFTPCRTAYPSPRSPVGSFMLAFWMVLAAILPASAVQAVLQPGEPAPPFTLKDLSGQMVQFDGKTSATTVLVFVKPGDRHTSQTMRAMEHMFQTLPALASGTRHWLVVCRMDNPNQAKEAAKIAGGRWTVLLDTEDKLYRDYKIIATPTVVVVGSNNHVAAAHPGYDDGLEHDVRQAVAKALGLELPQSMTGEPAKPNMTLQLGRRMAARGLWDQALNYYRKAEALGPLPPPAQTELAAIYIELERFDDALAVLAKIPAASSEAGRAAALVKRAQALKAGHAEKAKPPKIIR